MSNSSKKNVKEEVVRRLDLALTKLYQIWTRIGIDEGQVANRAGTVSLHLCNLMDEMVGEEEQLCHEMAENIKRFTDELSTLCVELAVPVVKVSQQLSMVQQEKESRTKLEALNKEKAERQARLATLKEEDQRLCDTLCCTPYYIPSHTVPSKDQLAELQAHISKLQAEKTKRHEQFVQTKEKIVKLCNEMDYDPDSSFERDLICEDGDDFPLSTENMENLKTVLESMQQKNEDLQEQMRDLWVRIRALWDRLELEEEERAQFTANHQGHKTGVLEGLRQEVTRCEQLKFANLQRFVEGARRELVDWWRQCYFSQAQRDAFIPFTEETYTEELLEAHEEELRKVQKYHKEHETVLGLMTKRETLWTKMLEYEKKASDPNRFFNDRGGRLLKEQKAHQKILKDLPKIEEDTKEEIEAWERENNRKLLLEGVSFAEYVDRQWETFKEQKIQEKEQRTKARAKQTEEEMFFGSKPATNTPAKRKFLNTPSKTPLKSRKLNETPRTPASVSRIQHSSVFHSPYSRTPLSAAKGPNMNHTSRRRSLRQARKVLQESMQNNNTSRSKKRAAGAGSGKADLFSQTTVSGGSSINNESLATIGAYNDFAARLKFSSSSASNPGNSTLLSAVSTPGRKG